jgi:hypothetical protein
VEIHVAAQLGVAQTRQIARPAPRDQSMTEEYAMNPNPETRIRCAIAGLKVLLVGGDPRPDCIQRIQTSLRLEEAIHCPTRKRDASAWSFASKLCTPRLVLVVCARGLTRTQHGSHLHDQCRRLNVPLLDCYHLPHPNALIGGIVKARLTDAVLQRCMQLKSLESFVIGGAA